MSKQLRRNIKALDVEIGELSKEINGLKQDTKYDVKMRTLSDLVKLRTDLVTRNEKFEISEDVIVELDKQIEELTKMISHLESDENYLSKVKKLEDLTKVRCQLSEAKTNESNMATYVPAVIGVVGGISAVLLVLNYEHKDEIITSKAFGIATKMFRGF